MTPQPQPLTGVKWSEDKPQPLTGVKWSEDKPQPLTGVKWYNLVVAVDAPLEGFTFEALVEKKAHKGYDLIETATGMGRKSFLRDLLTILHKVSEGFFLNLSRPSCQPILTSWPSIPRQWI